MNAKHGALGTRPMCAGSHGRQDAVNTIARAWVIRTYNPPIFSLLPVDYSPGERPLDVEVLEPCIAVQGTTRVTPT